VHSDAAREKNAAAAAGGALHVQRPCREIFQSAARRFVRKKINRWT